MEIDNPFDSIILKRERITFNIRLVTLKLVLIEVI